METIKTHINLALANATVKEINALLIQIAEMAIKNYNRILDSDEPFKIAIKNRHIGFCGIFYHLTPHTLWREVKYLMAIYYPIFYRSGNKNEVYWYPVNREGIIKRRDILLKEIERLKQ